MGYVFFVFVALLSVGATDFGWTQPTQWAHVWPLLGVVPYLLCHFSRRACLRGRFKRGAVLERAAGLWPVLGQLIAVFLLGWCEATQELGLTVSLEAWPGLGLLVAILPYIVLEVLSIDARARLFGQAQESRRSWRGLQLRLFASSVLPFVGYLLVSGLIGASLTLRVHFEEVALLNSLFSVALFGSFLLFLPPLLRRAWDTVPLAAGRVRTELETVARRAGFRCRELLVWRTGNQMANAAIIGLTPGSRIVVFTDALLAQLSLDELAAVFAHEIGHAKRHHVLIFGSFALGLILGADLLLGWAELEEGLLGAGLFIGVCLLWYLSFGYLSRRFESEADLVSLDLIGDSVPLIGALERVSGAHAREKSSWRHFSTSQRVEFLTRAEAQPEVGHRLRRSLRRWSIFSAVLFVVVLALQLSGLFGSLREDRTVAALRLARYERVLELAEGEAFESQRLGELVDRIRVLGPASLDSPLEPAARAALEAGDEALGRDLIELEVLSGRSELEPLLDLLDPDGVAAEDEAELLRDLDEDWRVYFEQR